MQSLRKVNSSFHSFFGVNEEFLTNGCCFRIKKGKKVRPEDGKKEKERNELRT